MNTPNNKRRKESKERIELEFVKLLQNKDVKDINVSDICKKAKVNRSTFYANYIDIYDLVDKIKENMLNEFLEIYKDEVSQFKHSYNFLKLFNHIKENQLFYKTYFKLGADLTDSLMRDNLNNEMILFFGNTKHLQYHIDFFKAGLNAIIIRWLNNNCKESPEEINEIIISEYTRKLDTKEIKKLDISI